MSTLKRILVLTIISCFFASIFVGCQSSQDTVWDPNKQMYVPEKSAK